MTALSLEELLPTDANASVISRVRSLLDGDPTPASLELTFAAREGVPVRVLASISRVALAGKSGFILVARDLSHPHPIAGSSMQLPDDPVLEELRASLLFLSEPLGSVLSPAPRCDLGTRIIDAARMMGSEGRGEQTLATDQDNALLYIDPAHHDYFLRLGEGVCAALDQAGYAFCKGENMARNPRYCRSLSEWIGQFRSWIAAANSQDLLNFSIFFDFRCVAGEPTLARDLRVSVRHALAEHPPFFLHMANSILAMRTPVGWFGRLALESRPDHPHALNLKDAMLPMVSFARLYALRQGIDATNTLDRIEQLATLQVLRRDFADELIQGYTFLMQLRLQRQASDIAAGNAPDNLLDPASLTPMEQSALRQALNVMTSLRKKVSYDFLGMA